MNINTIENKDALEGLREMESESIDCIITDPPWPYNSYNQFPNRNLTYNTVSNEYLEETFKELYRILKKGKHAYVFTTNLRLGKDITTLEKCGFRYNQTLILLANGIKLGYGYRHTYLPILFLDKEGTSVTNLHDVSNVLGPSNFNVLSKPVEIIDTFLRQSTKEGDIVFDPFMGSGSTAIACKRIGRNYLGFEIDKERFETTNIRIERTHVFDDMEVDE
jgi:DNA modification methylase|uniref:AMDV4_6 n=1 Tax=uncultured virus TaxID=340016 RepID=B3GAM7_9VIRU|nr:AMDV4_6 [uncultured virus]